MPRRPSVDPARLRANWLLVPLIFFIGLPDFTRHGAGVNLKPVVIAGMTRGLNGTGPMESRPVSPDFHSRLAFQGLLLLTAGAGGRGLEQREVGGQADAAAQGPVVAARMEPAQGPSFNDWLLKRRPAQERFWRLGGSRKTSREAGGRRQGQWAAREGQNPEKP